jgi:hypothetical protein
MELSSEDRLCMYPKPADTCKRRSSPDESTRGELGERRASAMVGLKD